MTSAAFEFDDILSIALGRPCPSGVSGYHYGLIKDRLTREIKEARIASLTTGLDPTGTQNRSQHDSLNHSVLYLELDGEMWVRLDMQINEAAKKGKAEMGDLIFKFQDYPYSMKEIMSIVRPWKSGHQIATLRTLVLLIHVGGIDKFLMDPELIGCRRWLKGFARVLIENGCFDLNTKNEILGWQDLSPAKHFKGESLHKELARLSIPRLDDYFKHYYTSFGEKREVDDSKGDFEPRLRSSRAIYEDTIAQLPYLLPEYP